MSHTAVPHNPAIEFRCPLRTCSDLLHWRREFPYATPLAAGSAVDCKETASRAAEMLDLQGIGLCQWVGKVEADSPW